MRDAPTEEELERFKGWYESQTTPSPTQGYIPTDSIVRKPQPTPEQIDKYRAWHRRYMFATSPLERYKHSLEDNQAIETALLDELETILPGMTQRAEQGIVSAPGPAPSQRERSRLEQAIVNRTGREWKGPLGRELSDAELKVIERTNRIRKYGGLPSLVAYAEKEADIKEKFKQTGKLPMNRAIDSVFIAQLRAPFDILKQAGSELKGEQAPDPMTGFGMATLVGTPTPPGALAAGVKIPIKGKGTRQVGGLPTQTISEIAALISKNGPNKYHAVILENQFGVRIAGKSGQDVFRVRGPELPPEGVFASENQLAKYGITKPWVGKYEPELETAVQQSQRMRLHYSDEATKRDLLKPKSIQNVEKAITEKGVRPFTTDIRGGRQAESLAAFEYQNSIPERIVHLDWDKANSYRFELEGAGDVLRELTKSTPDPGYIGEKLNRTKRLLNALETGKLHPDDSIIAARKYEPDKLNNLIAAYEKQPIANPDQQMAKDLVLALAKGDYATARQLHTTLSTKLATPRDQLQHPSVRAAIKDLETQPTQAYKTPTAGEQNAMNTFREDQLKQLPPATGVVETKGGPSTTTLKAGDVETNTVVRALTQRQGPKTTTEAWRALKETPQSTHYEALHTERLKMTKVPFTARDAAYNTRYSALNKEIDTARKALFETPESKLWHELERADSKIRSTAELERQKVHDLEHKSSWNKAPQHGADMEDLEGILKDGLNPGSALDYTSNKEWASEYPVKIVVPSALRGKKIEHNNYYTLGNRARAAKVHVDLSHYSKDAQEKYKVLLERLKKEYKDVVFEITDEELPIISRIGKRVNRASKADADALQQLRSALV